MDRHRSDGAAGEYGSVPHRAGRRRFLSYADLQERYGGKSRVTIWRWVRAGLLPAPYVTGPNSRGFDEQELDERDASLNRATYGQAVVQ